MTQDKALEILKSGVNVFLTGEPGAGKSYTINRFVDHLDEIGKNYSITASTGIAASHIDGYTIHSWSGLGIRRGLSDDEINGIKYNSGLSAKIRPVKVLIIDEVSMLDAVIISDIDRILKAVHQSEESFGGIQVVLVGDFYQLPPVAKGNAEKLFAFEARAWKHANFVTCYLSEQHRQSDKEFLDILSAMRNGTVSIEQKDRLISCISNEVPDTKLFTHNADVDALNAKELEKLPGKLKKYYMSSYGPDNLVASLKRNCLSPEVLELKEGAIVMFTRNNFNVGYVNGTIGKVVNFNKEGDPIVQLSDGSVVSPDLAKWTYKKKGEDTAGIKQLPLRLAWAITVHKSQGMSLDKASVDLSNTFEYGQGYVAISRVRSLDGLHLQGINAKAFEMHPKVIAQDKIFRLN